jgi:hypothetical protein
MVEMQLQHTKLIRRVFWGTLFILSALIGLSIWARPTHPWLSVGTQAATERHSDRGINLQKQIPPDSAASPPSVGGGEEYKAPVVTDASPRLIEEPMNEHDEGSPSKNSSVPIEESLDESTVNKLSQLAERGPVEQQQQHMQDQLSNDREGANEKEKMTDSTTTLFDGNRSARFDPIGPVVDFDDLVFWTIVPALADGSERDSSGETMPILRSFVGVRKQFNQPLTVCVNNQEFRGGRVSIKFGKEGRLFRGSSSLHIHYQATSPFLLWKKFPGGIAFRFSIFRNS